MLFCLECLSEKDRQLWEEITSPDNPLHYLLPPTRDRVLRNRGHSFIIPRIRTERFKSIFINRNLPNFRQLDTHIFLKLKFVNWTRLLFNDVFMCVYNKDYYYSQPFYCIRKQIYFKLITAVPIGVDVAWALM